jgi:hypothetical protein
MGKKVESIKHKTDTRAHIPSKEEAGYEAVGQMNMYLGYSENEENTEGNALPVALIAYAYKV